MSYEPTNWKTGDVVTSAKLNKLENAVAGAGGVLVINDQNNTLDKTYQEIENAFANKMLCVVFSQSEEGQTCNFVTMIAFRGAYGVMVFNASTQRMVVYSTDAKDGYPGTEK